MNINSLLICCGLAFLISCKEVVKTNDVQPQKQETVELANFIRYFVILDDTSFQYQTTKGTSKAITRAKANEFYLPESSFNDFKLSLYSVLRSDTGFVLNSKFIPAITKEERIACYKLCDSIMLNDNPKETIFACDSTSRIDYVTAIEFYEKWIMNKKDYSINKEIIGYAPLIYDWDKLKFKPSFYYFKSKDHFEKIKSQLQNSTK